MAEVTIEGVVPSIIITKKFLIDLFKTINSRNNRPVPIRTEITIKGHNETRVYKELRDLTDATYLPKKISAIGVIKEAKNEKDDSKVVSFEFNIDTDHPSESFYTLTGHDEGKLEVCKKEIDSLIDENKTWYWSLFKWMDPETEGSKGLYGIVVFATVLSLAFVAYRFLNLVRGIEQVEMNQTIAFISFFAFLWLSNKVSDRFFPYLDLRLRTSKRKQFWNVVAGLIIGGLLVSLIVEIAKWII